MFKRDDHIATRRDAAVFSKWQGFGRSMLLRKPLTELRTTLANYTSLSSHLGPKIPVGAEDFRRRPHCFGRYRVQRSIPGLYDPGVAVSGHDQGPKVDSDDVLVERIRSQLRPYGTHHDLIQKELISQRKPGLSPTIPLLLRKIGNRNEYKKLVFEKESEESLSRSRPQQISDRHDDIVDSVSGCLEDGTACTVTPIKGRTRCIEHKGQIISHVSSQKHLPCEAPTTREYGEAADICGVILPDMVPCRRKPVSRRKRCEDHKGMRVNAFFFLLNPTAYNKFAKEDKSKPATFTGMNQEDLGPGPCCEATTKNGLPCKRSAPKGSRRCWQHTDKTLGQSSSEIVQSATTSQRKCGVKLYNGLCENSPVKGRKRCEDHKGMRITA